MLQAHVNMEETARKLRQESLAATATAQDTKDQLVTLGHSQHQELQP